MSVCARFRYPSVRAIFWSRKQVGGRLSFETDFCPCGCVFVGLVIVQWVTASAFSSAATSCWSLSTSSSGALSALRSQTSQTSIPRFRSAWAFFAAGRSRRTPARSFSRRIGMSSRSVSYAGPMPRAWTEGQSLVNNALVRTTSPSAYFPTSPPGARQM